MSTTTGDFATPASEAMLGVVAGRLRDRNFEVLIVSTAADAKAAVLERIRRAQRFTRESPKHWRTSVSSKS